MALLLSAVRLVPAQNLVDVPLDGLQLLEPLFLFVIGVIQAVFLGDKLLDLGLQRFPGGHVGNAMRLEIPGCCVGYDKIALMGLPVCGAGFDGHTLLQQQRGKLVKLRRWQGLSVGSAAASPCSFQTWSAGA